jgi:hypothetical protein
MKIVAWAYFQSSEEKEALQSLVDSCNSFPELYVQLSRLYPEEEAIMVNKLAKRLIKEKKNG